MQPDPKGILIGVALLVVVIGGYFALTMPMKTVSIKVDLPPPAGKHEQTPPPLTPAKVTFDDGKPSGAK